jgi:hypothetical protein
MAKRDEVVDGRRKFHDEERHGCIFSPDILIIV